MKMGLCTEKLKNVPAKRKNAGTKVHFLMHRPIYCFYKRNCKEKVELLGLIFDIDPAPVAYRFTIIYFSGISGSDQKFFIRSNLDVMPTIIRSSTVRAAMHSTTTTARGTIIGSWRPLMEIEISSPDLLTVCCSWLMDGVGLKAARKRISLPSLMPPRVPPEWLESFFTWPSSIPKGVVVRTSVHFRYVKSIS